MEELSELERVRWEKLKAILDAGMEPYPHRTNRTHSTQQAINAFEEAGEDEQIKVAIAGRLRSIRKMGKSTFATLRTNAAGCRSICASTN
jgi:lysyl-tRNA synthetase class 2